jgi:hypothetical protein
MNLCRAILFCCVTSAGFAEGEIATPLKTSQFEAARVSRNPFERIDAKHLAEKALVVTIAGPSGPDMTKIFRVTGISKDRLAIAVINGRAFAENESFIARASDKEYHVIVKRVSDTGADLECDGTLWQIPITRPGPLPEVRKSAFDFEDKK